MLYAVKLRIMERKYLITQEQLEQIEHYKRMFELNADLVKDLCDSEKDDIVYGFELGKMHSHLRDCFIEMMDLVNEIRNPKVVDETKSFNMDVLKILS